MNIKQKVKCKMQQTSIDIFSNQTLWEFTNCLCEFIQITMTILKSIINRKNFCDQPIDSNIKLYEEIRKLAACLGELYYRMFVGL